MPKRFVIEFRFPSSGTLYAGVFKGALGWANNLDGAIVYDDAKKARRIAKNGYGLSAQHAHVMEIDKKGRLTEVKGEE